MRFRFVFFFACCFVAVKCFFQTDETTGDTRETQAYVRDDVEGRRNEHQSFPNAEGTHGLGDFSGQSSNFERLNSNNRETFGRPSSSEYSSMGSNQNNRESGQYSTSIGSNKQQSVGGSSHTSGIREGENRPFSRPTGGSSFGSDHREGENRPSGSRPNGGSFASQTGTQTTGHREGENHPFGSSSSGGSSFGRPTEASNFGTDHREKENRPSRPSTSGGFSRPSGESSHGTNHRESESSSTGSRPGDNSFSRPTEETPSGFGSQESQQQFGRPIGSHTNHRESESSSSGSRPGDNSFSRPTGGHTGERPSGFGSQESQQFGRPTGENIHNQQIGIRPDNQEGTQRPGSEEHEHSVNNEKNNDKNGKEEDKDVCFHSLGCFKMGKPWKSVLRPIGAPHGPEKIQTKIHLYTRQNLEKPKNITVYPDINMGEARFDPSKITAMIVHGFSNSGNATWMRDMKNVYLKKVDANVMIVDWGKGAQLLNYLQVAGNTRVVGKQLGLFVKYLIDNFGADPGKFHLIGHSLGAQICSYLGKEVRGIARLTALDPAQPGFEGFDTEVRLDKNDAEFVDVLHTDARPFIPTLGFGMITPHGHVDFYMNGGFDQPGCVPPPKKELPSVKNILDLAKFPVEVIAKTVACPHARAYEYLIESFNETDNCIFWGHKADVKNIFKSVTNTVTQGLLKKFTALSTTCSKEDCIPVGFATKKSPLRGVFVVTTNSRSPYCISEPGIPPETPPHERKHDSFVQKIGKKTGVAG